MKSMEMTVWPRAPRTQRSRLAKATATVVLAGVLASALSGCGSLVNKAYEAPDVAVPGNWQQPEGKTPGKALATNGGADVKAVDGDGWWRRFDDAGLNAMIDQVLVRNGDMAAAAIAVHAAQLQAQLTHANEFPTLSGTYEGSKSRYLNGGQASSAHALTGGVSYEADLWGRLSQLTDAQRWEAFATQQDLESTRLSLIGTAANLYWKLSYLNERIASERKSVAYLEEVLKLVRVQREAGASSSLEVLEAEQSVESERSTLTQLIAQHVAARMSLAALLADPAGGSVPTPPNLFDLHVPSVDAGVPVEVLARRPDLQAAEMRLREQFANVNATRAYYYPTFTLTGSLGTSSTALTDLLKNPIGTLGATLSLPFLNWKTRDLSIRSSQATYDKAVQTFRQTLYTALTDVETALSARTQYLQQGEQLQRSLNAARAVERIYAVRYRTGHVSLRIWLEAQESVRSAERTLAENRYNQLTESVTLYQALGGDTAPAANPEERVPAEGVHPVVGAQSAPPAPASAATPAAKG